MLGKVSQGRISPQLSETKVKKSVLSSRVTCREILVITIYVMNVQDNWEVGNIKGKAATTVLNALQLTL